MSRQQNAGRRSGSEECIGKMKNAYAILVEKLKGKISLGRSRLIWQDNIKTDIEISVLCKGWIHMAQDFVKTIMNLRVS
jgi:hypothetical protein